MWICQKPVMLYYMVSMTYHCEATCWSPMHHQKTSFTLQPENKSQVELVGVCTSLISIANNWTSPKGQDIIIFFPGYYSLQFSQYCILPSPPQGSFGSKLKIEGYILLMNQLDSDHFYLFSCTINSVISILTNCQVDMYNVNLVVREDLRFITTGKQIPWMIFLPDKTYCVFFYIMTRFLLHLPFMQHNLLII